jgi:hypothetical protein
VDKNNPNIPKYAYAWIQDAVKSAGEVKPLEAAEAGGRPPG